MSAGDEMTAGNGIPYSKTNAIDQEKKLLEPLAYLLQVPGKNIRKKLLHAFNFWMHVEEKKVHAIGEIVQMLHNASLLVDDIEDNSILRRGIPVAHKVKRRVASFTHTYYVLTLSFVFIAHSGSFREILKKTKKSESRRRSSAWRAPSTLPIM